MLILIFIAQLFFCVRCTMEATIRNGALKLRVLSTAGVPRLELAEGNDQGGLELLRVGLERPPSAGVELIEWIADCGSVICTVPRPLAITHTLLHRGMGVVIWNHNKEKIFVHQRSSNKRVFPSMYDMLVGGVCSPGEPTAQTLQRELAEEAGIDLSRSDPGAIKCLGHCRIQTSYNFCQVDCYSVVCSEAQEKSVVFADGEIQWGEFVTRKYLEEVLLPEKEFVPDGLQVWDWMQGKL